MDPEFPALTRDCYRLLFIDKSSKIATNGKAAEWMEIAVNFPLPLTPRLPNPLAVAMPKLTKRFVDSLARPPAGRDLYVWDSEVRGFGYRLKANGTGAWIFQYRKHGISRRLTIGSYPGGGCKDT